MVTAALTLALGAYFLTVVHRLETYAPKFNRTDYSHVVVAGVDGLRHATVPANIGDTVEVIADVSQVKTRIVFDQYVAVNGAPAAFARISCVCVDVIRGRPVAPPDVVVSKFNKD